MKKEASLVVHVNEDGEVIQVKNVDLSAVKYGEKDKKLKRTMIGARIFTPNGCCWKKINNVWVCGTCP